MLSKAFFPAVAVLALSATQANASNYPPDYCDQTARVVTLGAGVFANVGSGCLSSIVFGYKGSGALARSNPDSIDAVIVGQCKLRDGSVVQKTSVVNLGREWRGSGYMSSERSTYDFLPSSCSTHADYATRQASYRVAFSDRSGQWEPSNGEAYVFGGFIFGDDAAIHRTRQGGTQINSSAWDFIIDQMRK